LSRDQREAAGAHEKPDAGSQSCRCPHAPGQSRDDFGLACHGRSGERNGCEAPTRGGSASRQLDSAFAQATSQIQGHTVIDEGLFIANAKLIAELAIRNQLPGIGFREYCEAGGLAAYGVNFPHIWRRAAAFVDKIFKGAKPADLPIEQATTLSQFSVE